MGYYPSEGDVDANGAEEVNLRTSAGAELLGQQVSAASLPVVISTEQQEYLLRTSEQQLALENKVFITSFEITTVGTTEIPVFLFRNPSGSGKTVKLIRLTLTNFTTVNSFIRVRAYLSPTITADGTGLTEACTHIGQAGPVSVTFSSPTASANGTRVSQWETPGFSNALVIPMDLLFILDANTQIILTGQADGTNRTLGCSMLWAEV
jgi:hypothetical protein